MYPYCRKRATGSILHTKTNIIPIWLMWLLIVDFVWMVGFILAAFLSRVPDRGVRASLRFSCWLIAAASLLVLLLGVVLHRLDAVWIGLASALAALLLGLLLRSTSRKSLPQFAAWPQGTPRVGPIHNTLLRLTKEAREMSAEALLVDIAATLKDYPPQTLFEHWCAAISWATWQMINNPYHPAGWPTDQKAHSLQVLTEWIASNMAFPNPQLSVPFERCAQIMQQACTVTLGPVVTETAKQDLRDLVVLLSGLTGMLAQQYDMSTYAGWAERIAQHVTE